MAALQFTDSEVARIVGLSQYALRRDYRDDLERGRLKAEAEVRRAILQMAKQGSTPAQKQFAALHRRAHP